MHRKRGALQRGRGAEHAPEVLAAAYPLDAIWKLGDLLSEWGMQPMLPGDRKRVRVQLAQRTLVVVRRNEPVPSLGTGSRSFSLERLLPRNEGIACERSERGRAALEALRSNAFATLHSSVGDGVIELLLNHTAVFFPPRANSRWLVQVCGSPLAWRLSSDCNRNPLWSGRLTRANNSASKVGEHISELSAVQLPNPDDLKAQTTDSTHLSAAADSESVIRKRSRSQARPPKWARARKRQKTDGEQGTQTPTPHEREAEDVDHQNEERTKATFLCSNERRPFPQNTGPKPKSKIKLSISRAAKARVPSLASQRSFPSLWSVARKRGESKRAARMLLSHAVFGQDNIHPTIPHKLRSLLEAFCQTLKRARSLPVQKILNEVCPSPLSSANDASNHRWLKLLHNLTFSRSLATQESNTSGQHGIDADHVVPAQDSPGTASHLSIASLVKRYETHERVSKFLWKCIRRTLAPSLLGDRRARRAWRRAIGRLLSLRKGESIEIHDLMKRLPLSRFVWPFVSSDAKCRIGSSGLHSKLLLRLAHFTHWLVDDVCMPLIRRNFVATSSQHDKFHVFYYRKHVWKTLKMKAVNHLIPSLYKRVSKRTCSKPIGSGSGLGHVAAGASRLMFIPRPGGLRSIACFSSRRTSLATSVNEDLQFALRALQVESEKLEGATVLQYSTVLRRLLNLRRSLDDSHYSGPVYICVSDVSSAFDALNRDEAYNVSCELLNQGHYFLKSSRFAKTNLEGRTIEDYQSVAAGASGQDIDEIQRRNPAGILTHLQQEHCAPRERVLAQIADGLYNVKLCIHGKLLQHTNGMPQGLVLSTLLCCATLAHMERGHLCQMLEDPHGCLMRWIDDYIYITTSVQKAENFLSHLSQGNEKYGCFISRSKTGVNFASRFGSKEKLRDGGRGRKFMPWCGLLIDESTLEVRADYDRLCGSSLLDGLRVFKRADLRKRLINFLCPKCHPIFFHPRLNTSFTALLNYYQMFLVSMAKLIAHTASCRIRLPGVQSVRIILGASRHTRTLAMRRARNAGFCDVRHMYLTKQACSYLALKAAYDLLRRKHARHPAALCAINATLQSTGAMRKQAHRLRSVVDWSHSQFIERMIF